MSHVIMCDTCGTLKSVNDEDIDHYTRLVRKSEQGVREEKQFHICHSCTGGSKERGVTPQLRPGGEAKQLTD